MSVIELTYMPRKPTEKQKATTAYLVANPKASITEAMREGGKYAENTVLHPGKNFLGSPGAISSAEELRVALLGKGVSLERVAGKINEWLDATKPFSSHTEPDRDIPDYQTQIKAGELALKAHNAIDQQTLIGQANFYGLKDKYNKGGE